MDLDRRRVLLAAAGATLMPAIARALSIDADVRTGTIADVEHVVILMQENRSFDHYFGAMRGVRGFGDRFPIPLADTQDRVAGTAWVQANPVGGDRPSLVSPFPLNTADDFRLMRVEGTPHSWADAQAAWDEGRMSAWPIAKTEHSMGYFRPEDIPFQYALADAFTLCDAYHCSIQTGTNSNRLFLWTGTNDPSGRRGGPAISNSHDALVADGGHPDSYRWTTYPERLLAAGVSWRIYQDMADNFTDNPTAGFQTYRDSHDGRPGADPRLAELALSTRTLDGPREAALNGVLPQVSWIVAPAKDSEHPGPSSPAQGADYTARVIEALTADPRVWARTVLLVMFDENDGFFDHVPPPAPPSPARGEPADAMGGSTVDTAGEHHLETTPSEASSERPQFTGRPYGLGPRVPLYVISPWSRGGWVNSQVFDHTSVIRFLETRFGVAEPNISPWRRAVCGDLTSAFDFTTPNRVPLEALPLTRAAADRASALPGRTTPRDAGPTSRSHPGRRLPAFAGLALWSRCRRGQGGRRHQPDLPQRRSGRPGVPRLRSAAPPPRAATLYGRPGAHPGRRVGGGGLRSVGAGAERLSSPLHGRRREPRTGPRRRPRPGRRRSRPDADQPVRSRPGSGVHGGSLCAGRARPAGAPHPGRGPGTALAGRATRVVRSVGPSVGRGPLRQTAGRPPETGAPSITDPAMGGPAIMDQRR